MLFFINHFQLKGQNKSQNEEKIEKVCRRHKQIGDGICDDESNVYECDFDGGDCCGSNVNTYYCSVCACLEY